ncbi:hypothetical protein KC361_g19 [Hortaea werneckii]|nr:hypothetical protein KC361_g19 [Hortaea werneckii]
MSMGDRIASDASEFGLREDLFPDGNKCPCGVKMDDVYLADRLESIRLVARQVVNLIDSKCDFPGAWNMYSGAPTTLIITPSLAHVARKRMEEAKCTDMVVVKHQLQILAVDKGQSSCGIAESSVDVRRSCKHRAAPCGHSCSTSKLAMNKSIQIALNGTTLLGRRDCLPAISQSQNVPKSLAHDVLDPINLYKGRGRATLNAQTGLSQSTRTTQAFSALHCTWRRKRSLISGRAPFRFDRGGTVNESCSPMRSLLLDAKAEIARSSGLYAPRNRGVSRSIKVPLAFRAKSEQVANRGEEMILRWCIYRVAPISSLRKSQDTESF